MTAPYTPRQELRALIVNALAHRNEYIDEVADAVMKIFGRVEDEWTLVNVTTTADDGQREIQERYLVAYVYRQSEPNQRIANREIS